MPVTADQAAPYAPSTAVMALIERHRTKGLPSPVDADVLARAGISASLIARTLQALQSLDLIDEDGKHTAVLEGLRLAPEAEYKQRLAEWLSAAYADALQYVDPATDDETKVRDAFRSYKPIGQQSRMVTLFMGLFGAAGIAPERQRTPTRKSGSTQSAPRTRALQNPKPGTHGGGGGGGAAGSGTRVRLSGGASDLAIAELPPPILGMLASLPTAGGSWTKADRDRFMMTFGAVIDFSFPVAPAGKPMRQQADTEDDEV